MARSRQRTSRVLLVVGVVIVASCSGGDDGESILKVEERLEADNTERCLDVDASVGPEVEDLNWVSCEVSHSHEVYHAVNFVPEDAAEACDGKSNPCVYPGFAELESFSQRECLGAFEPYVGFSAFDSRLFYSWMVPTLTSWNDHDDYEIICVAGQADSQPLQVSIRGSRL